MENRGYIIITGHTGVIGKGLHQRLTGKNIELVLINSRGVHVQTPGSEPRMLTQNIFDRPMLQQIFQQAKACVHMAAAQPGAVSEGVVGALLRNALLTDYFTGLASDTGLPAFVYASSGAIYYRFGDPLLSKVDESIEIQVDPVMVEEASAYLTSARRKGDYASFYACAGDAFGPDAAISSISPRDGYAFGKYIGELCVAQNLSAGCSLNLRLANVFSPWDHSNRIIPKFIRAAKTGTPLNIYDWSRNFIWIDDLLDIIERGISLIADAPQTVNAFTPGNTITLWDLAHKISTLMPEPKEQFKFDANVHEPPYEWDTLFPVILPESPVTLEEGLLRMLSR